MVRKHEVIWHVSGSVVETIYNSGTSGKNYWQIVLEVDGGYVCLYARSEQLRITAENLCVGQWIEASGTIKPRKIATEAKRPVFFDPVDQIGLINL